MTGLAELRSTVARLERTYAALRSTEGNPHHDADGKFTSAGGEGGHHAGRARRKRHRKRQLQRMHREARNEAVGMRARHRGERRELIRDQRKDWRGLKREQKAERKGLVRDQARERRGEAGKANLREMRGGHRRERQAMLEAQHEERASRHADYQEDRRGMRQTHHEERRELVENLRYDLEDEGFRRKGGGKPSEQPAKRRERQRGLDQARVGTVGRGLPEGWPDGDGAWRRFHASRIHKASSAEAILKHCLRQRGWTAAWRKGEMTGKEQLDLLGDIREYSRAWLRHEAEALFLHHGDPDYHRGAPLGSLDRGIAASVASHVTRWFRRAKSFVHEAIVAGAMALSGPGELTSDDLREADDQAQRQAQYFDRFMLDAHTRPPAGLADDPEAIANAMTAAQFVARAEQYGDAPWGAAQHVERARMVRGRVYVEERRIHGRLLDDMCATCAEAVARGWVPIGTLPPIGDSECIGNCHCYFKYRDADGNVAKTVRKSKGKRKPLLTRRPVVAQI